MGGVKLSPQAKSELGQLSSSYPYLSDDVVFDTLFQCAPIACLAEIVQTLPPETGAYVFRLVKNWVDRSSNRSILVNILKELSLDAVSGDALQPWPWGASSRFLPKDWFQHPNCDTCAWPGTLSETLGYPEALWSFCEDFLSVEMEKDVQSHWFLQLLLSSLAAILAVIEQSNASQDNLALLHESSLLKLVGHLDQFRADCLSDISNKRAEFLLSCIARCKSALRTLKVRSAESTGLYPRLVDSLAKLEDRATLALRNLEEQEKCSAVSALNQSIESIERKTRGYADDWESLLTHEEHWTSEQWLLCVESNFTHFVSRALCLQLVAILAWAHRERSDEVHRRVTAVLLRVYERLSAVEQWSVRNGVLSRHCVDSKSGWVNVFVPVDESTSTARQQHPATLVASGLTGLLNRLHVNEERAGQPLAATALLMPLKLLKDIVTRVFAQPGLIDVAVAFLRSLGLGYQTLRDNSSLFCSALEHCMQQCTLGADTVEKLSKVVAQFVEAACVQFSLEESKTFNGETFSVSIPLRIVRPSELLQSVLMPRLKATVLEDTKEAFLDCQLQVRLLDLAFRLCDNVWPTDVSVEDALSVISGVWLLCCVAEQSSLQLRACVLNTIASISKLMEMCLEGESEPAWSAAAFLWLTDNLPTMDWQFGLLWQSLASRLACPPLKVPAALLRVCDLPQSKWQGVAIAEYGGGQVWLALLQFVRAGPDLAEVALASLKRKVTSNVERLSRFVVLATAQLLPTCSRDEWTILVEWFFLPLLKRDLLDAPSAVSGATGGGDCETRDCVRLANFIVLVLQSACDLIQADTGLSEDVNDGSLSSSAGQRWVIIASLLSASLRGIVQELTQPVVDLDCSADEMFSTSVSGVFSSTCTIIALLPPSFSEAVVLVALSILDQELVRKSCHLCQQLRTVSHAVLEDHPALPELLLHLPQDE